MSPRKVSRPAPVARVTLTGKAARPDARASGSGPNFYELRLYIAGKTARAESALRNLVAICETHLQNRFRIEVVDLLDNPQLAAGDQIFAVPTLVRQLPPPVKKIIGDLSNVERVLVGLDLRPLPARRAAP